MTLKVIDLTIVVLIVFLLLTNNYGEYFMTIMLDIRNSFALNLHVMISLVMLKYFWEVMLDRNYNKK